VVGFVTVTVAAVATAYAAASTRLPSAVSFKSCGLSGRTAPGLPRDGRIAFPDPDSRGVNAVAWCANGRLLATADANGEAYVWSVATHKIVAVLPHPHSRGVNAVAVAPDGMLVATGDANGHRGVRGVAFTPSGRFLAAGDADGRLYLWALTSYKIVEVLADAGSQGVRAVAFSQNGRLVAAGDGNGRTYLSDVSHIGIQAFLTAASR